MIHIKIRQGTIDEMFSLWFKFYTSDFFADNLQRGNAEFWTIEEQRKLIGEIYLFWSLEDRDFADGETTAYLYGLQIDEHLRGRGYGTKLIHRVLERLCELNFSYATIGVSPGETANLRLYYRLGFDHEVKRISVNPCDVDQDANPTAVSEYLLLRKAL